MNTHRVIDIVEWKWLLTKHHEDFYFADNPEENCLDARDRITNFMVGRWSYEGLGMGWLML